MIIRIKTVECGIKSIEQVSIKYTVVTDSYKSGCVMLAVHLYNELTRGFLITKGELLKIRHLMNIIK